MLLILVIGLIIVALMVYTSTRIKRTAAAAFERETIEKSEFSIEKPEGFLHNLNGRPEYVFEAYSKDFSEEQPGMRVGTATISRLEERSIDDLADELIAEGFTDQLREVRSEHRHRALSIENETDPIARFIKLGQSNDSVYKLEIVTPQASSRDAWIETFMDTFSVK